MCRPEITPVLQLSSSQIFGSLVRPSVQSAATSNWCPIGGVRRPIGGVPISMMLRGCTKFPAVETTHIHDILRVRGIKNYFNEFLSNCLAFSRSKFVHLPHCRQHCHINCFAASGIQASESKLRILVTPNGGFLASTSTEFKPWNPRFGIQAPRFGIQAGAGFINSSSHPPPRNPCIDFRSH